MLFAKDNYLLMAVGLLVVMFGFVLMAGGHNDDPSTFPVDEIYSFRRITLAPLVVMFGYGFIMYAILFKGKKESSDNPDQKSHDK